MSSLLEPELQGLPLVVKSQKKLRTISVVDDGPLGTTCARVGCMPSKVLIQVANDHHQSQKLISKKLVDGTVGKINQQETMAHVRSLRDRFVNGVLSGMPEWEDKFIKGRTEFVDDKTVSINGELIQANSFIIATGSRPILPGPWKDYTKFFLDTDSFFEQETLPDKILVVGLGVIGLELGQALSRLGTEVVGVYRGNGMGGLTDPKIQSYVHDKLKEEFPVFSNGVEFTGDPNAEQISAKLDGEIHKFDKVVLAVGRRPNVDKMGLENLNITLDKKRTSRNRSPHDGFQRKVKHLPSRRRQRNSPPPS